MQYLIYPKVIYTYIKDILIVIFNKKWYGCKMNMRVSNITEEFQDTNGVNRIRKSKMDKQHNDQRKKDKIRSTNHST